MEEHPDSAMMILEGIDIDELSHPGDKALFGLLNLQALDKNHLPLDDDSLIDLSIDYFDDMGDIRRLAQSCYCKGRSLFYRKSYTLSMVEFFKSLELAENIGDYYLAGMSCRGIADIFNKTYNTSDEVEYAEKELEYLCLSRRQPYVDYAMLDLCQSLYNNRNNEEMYRLLRQVEDSAVMHGDPYLLTEAKRLKSRVLVTEKDFRTARSLLQEINDDGYGIFQDSLLLALSLVETGQISEAEKVLESVTEKEDVLAHVVQFNIYKKKGDLKAALIENEYLDSVSNLTLKKGISHSLSSSLAEYFELERKTDMAELKAYRFRMMVVILLALIVIGSLSVLICAIIRRHRRQLEEKMRVAETLKMELELNMQDNIQNQEIKRALLGDNFQMLDGFGKILMETPDEKKALKKTAEAVGKFLDELSVCGERTRTLENKVDIAYDNLFSDFREDLPGLKDADYLLYLYSVLHISNATISVLLKEQRVESVYNRKRRLKDKIKSLEENKSSRYLRYL